jgi:hypothetical protein
VRFGVREHGMGAITNGFALHNVSSAVRGLRMCEILNTFIAPLLADRIKVALPYD